MWDIAYPRLDSRFRYEVRKRKEPSILYCSTMECFGLRDLTFYRYYKLLIPMLCVCSNRYVSHTLDPTYAVMCLLCVNNRRKISFEVELEAVMTRQIIPEIFSLYEIDVACRPMLIPCSENICPRESTDALNLSAI